MPMVGVVLGLNAPAKTVTTGHVSQPLSNWHSRISAKAPLVGLFSFTAHLQYLQARGFPNGLAINLVLHKRHA